jgi:hypothetical protein
MEEGSSSVYLQFSSSDRFGLSITDPHRGAKFGLSNAGKRGARTKNPLQSSDVGSWVHWAGTFTVSRSIAVFKDGVTQELYVYRHGFSHSAYQIGSTSVSSPVIWGRSSSNGYYPFTGSMDELRTYVGVALTAGQLTSVMSSLATSDTFLVSYLAFQYDGLLNMDYKANNLCDSTSSFVTSTTGKLCGAVVVPEATAVVEGGTGCCPILIENVECQAKVPKVREFDRLYVLHSLFVVSSHPHPAPSFPAPRIITTVTRSPTALTAPAARDANDKGGRATALLVTLLPVPAS